MMFLISRGLEKKFDKKRAEIAGERKIICDGAATVHGNGANSYHDSNYSTFHRIKNFRKI